MNSAPQSDRDVEAARVLVADVEALDARGWRLASPVWFPVLWTSIAVLASVPAALLLDGANAAGWYWAAMAPVSAIASGWFFAGEMAPWLVVGAGFAVFAAAWRSASTAVFAGLTWATALAVAVVEPANGYLVVTLVAGVAAGVAAMVELLRADRARGL